MLRKTIKEEQNDLFNVYKENVYFERMKLQVAEYKLLLPEQFTPCLLEQSPYKLHISLSYADFHLHKEKLKEILFEHIRVGCINEFKMVQDDLTTPLEATKKILSLLMEYKDKVRSNETISVEWREAFITHFNNYYHTNMVNFPEIETIDNLINSANIKIKSIDRFFLGDQFTIYIPVGFNPHHILNLCKDLNNYLEKHHAQPGKKVDVASPIGHFLSLRQEYILEDFKNFNEERYVDLDKRINAIPNKFDEVEKERRESILMEQEKSQLYQFLKFYLTQSLAQIGSMFQGNKTPDTSQLPLNSNNKTNSSNNSNLT